MSRLRVEHGGRCGAAEGTDVRQQIAIAPGSLLVAAATASGQVPPPVTAPGPLAVVTKLYQEYAAQAVIDSPEFSMEDLFGRPRAAMARYLDDPLIALVLADRACSARKQEVCNLDFMPIWDAQDAAGATVKISEGKDPSRVPAEIHFPTACAISPSSWSRAPLAGAFTTSSTTRDRW